MSTYALSDEDKARILAALTADNKLQQDAAIDGALAMVPMVMAGGQPAALAIAEFLSAKMAEYLNLDLVALVHGGGRLQATHDVDGETLTGEGQAPNNMIRWQMLATRFFVAHFNGDADIKEELITTCFGEDGCVGLLSGISSCVRAYHQAGTGEAQQ